MEVGRELDKHWNIRVTVILNVIGALGKIPQRFAKGVGRVRNQRNNRGHPNNSIV